MSTEKAWQDAIAQWATPFVRSTEVPSSIPPPQHAIFGLNTSHEPLANPIRSNSEADDHANSGPGGGAKLLIPKYGLDYDSTESRTCLVHFRGPKSLG